MAVYNIVDKQNILTLDLFCFNDRVMMTSSGTKIVSYPVTLCLLVVIKGGPNGFNLADYKDSFYIDRLSSTGTVITSHKIDISKIPFDQPGTNPSVIKSTYSHYEKGIIYDTLKDPTLSSNSGLNHFSNNTSIYSYRVRLGENYAINNYGQVSSHVIGKDRCYPTNASGSTINAQIVNYSQNYYPGKRWDIYLVDNDLGEKCLLSSNVGTSNDPASVDTSFDLSDEAWGIIARTIPNEVSTMIKASGFTTGLSYQMYVYARPSSEESTQGTEPYVIYDDGYMIGSSVQLPASIRPSITTVTPSDTKGYRTTFGVYVQGKSILAATTTAQGIYNSTIAKVDYEIDNKTASTTDLSLVKTIGLLEQSGSRTLKTTVTDSRGRTAIRNTAITVAPYVNPTMNLQVLRWDSMENNESDDSDTVRLICSGIIPNINDNLVTGTIIVQGRQKGVSEWTSLGTAEVSGTFEEIFTVSNQSVDSIWEYQATLTDYFGVSVLSESSVGLATPILEFHSSGKGVGLGIVAPEEGFDIGMDVNVKGVQENGYSRIQITDPDGINSNILANLGGDTLRLLDQVLGVDRAFVGSHLFLDNNIALGSVTTSGGQTPILRMNASNQVELTWTSGGLKGRVAKQLWSGTVSEGGSVTVSELPYYNVFAIRSGNSIGVTMRQIGFNSAYLSLTCRNSGADDATSSENSNSLWLQFSGTTAKLVHSRLWNGITNAYINGNPQLNGIYGLL